MEVPLPQDYIQSILNAIPPVKSPILAVSQFQTEELKSSIRRFLETINLNPKAHEEYKARVLHSLSLADAESGTPIGIQIAGAIIAPLTQLTMNAFHTAGAQKNAESGVKLVLELLTSPHNPRHHPSLTFHPKRYAKRVEDIIDMRSYFVGITVKSLIKNNDDGLPMVKIRRREDLKEYWWLEECAELLEMPVPESSYVMRIHFDTALLYMHRVSMTEIVKAIDATQSGQICYYSPISEGIMDIYPIPSKIEDTLGEYEIETTKEEAFLSVIMRTLLETTLVKGNKNITHLFPAKMKVLSIVGTVAKYLPRNEEEETEFGRENLYIIYVNKYKVPTNGVDGNMLATLLLEAGVDVLSVDSLDHIIVRHEGDPIAHVRKLLSIDDTEESEARKEAALKGEVYIHMPTKLQQVANVIYGETNGTDLLAVVGDPDIDAGKTFSNDFKEIQRVYGLEAARLAHATELYIAIGSGGGVVLPQYVELISNIITHPGGIFPIAYNALVRNTLGPYAAATSQEPTGTYLENAIKAREETMTTVSGAVMIGGKIPVGTGAVKIKINTDILRQMETEFGVIPNLEEETAARKFIDYEEELTFFFGGSEEGTELAAALEEVGRQIVTAVDTYQKSAEIPVKTTRVKSPLEVKAAVEGDRILRREVSRVLPEAEEVKVATVPGQPAETEKEPGSQCKPLRPVRRLLVTRKESK